MSSHRLSSVPAIFTDQLLPRASEPDISRDEDALLPLIQHWVLALMLKVDKPYKLLDSGHLRRLFKIGKPEHWNTRHDEPVEYADDEERSYEADIRRKAVERLSCLRMRRGGLRAASRTSPIRCLPI